MQPLQEAMQPFQEAVQPFQPPPQPFQEVIQPFQPLPKPFQPLPQPFQEVYFFSPADPSPARIERVGGFQFFLSFNNKWMNMIICYFCLSLL